MFSKIKETQLLVFSAILLLCSIVTIAFISYHEMQITDRVEEQWERFHGASETKGLLLIGLYEQLGYHGLSQHFHQSFDYRNIHSLDHVIESIEDVESVITKYRQLDLNEEEKSILLSIEELLDRARQEVKDFRPQVKNDQAYKQVMNNLYLYDELVFKALNKLKSLWIVDFESVEIDMEVALEDSTYITSFGLSSLPLFITFSSIIIWVLYRTFLRLNQVNNKIHDSEAFISDIISSSAEAIVTINSKGEIVLFNPAAEKLFGYESDEVIGKDVSIIVPEHERKEHQGYVARSELYTTRIIHNVRELWAQRKNGTQFPLELNVSRMRHHEEPHFIGVCRDVTERRKIEEQQKAAQHATEKALQEAEKASQAKSQFLSSMSHELRTPLNSIIGFSQLVQMDQSNNLTANQLKNISEIENAGHHLLSLINQVLDMSKIESGNLDLNIDAVFIGDLIGQCETFIRPMLEKYNVSYKANYDACEQVVIETDHLRLKQILLNLMSNACKYNKVGGIVETQCEVLGDSIRISVIDTGIGINPSEVNELFEPFNRLGAECGLVEGTGIGLNISLKLAELLGANLGVESEPAKGSRFWLDVPLKYHA